MKKDQKVLGLETSVSTYSVFIC